MNQEQANEVICENLINIGTVLLRIADSLDRLVQDAAESQTMLAGDDATVLEVVRNLIAPVSEKVDQLALETNDEGSLNSKFRAIQDVLSELKGERVEII